MDTTLIPLARLPVEAPTWPYSPWSTGHMIRTGKLGCVRAGRRVFVTRKILEDFVAKHTVAQP